VRNILSILICFSTFLVFLSVAQAEQRKITDAYSETLEVYLETGDKVDNESVTKAEVKDKFVLDTARNGHLVKVAVGEKEVWLRSRQLKFETPQAASCPESGVTVAADRTAPVTSGIGCNR